MALSQLECLLQVSVCAAQCVYMVSTVQCPVYALLVCCQYAVLVCDASTYMVLVYGDASVAGACASVVSDASVGLCLCQCKYVLDLCQCSF